MYIVQPCNFILISFPINDLCSPLVLFLGTMCRRDQEHSLALCPACATNNVSSQGHFLKCQLSYLYSVDPQMHACFSWLPRISCIKNAKIGHFSLMVMHLAQATSFACFYCQQHKGHKSIGYTRFLLAHVLELVQSDCGHQLALIVLHHNLLFPTLLSVLVPAGYLLPQV